MGDYFRKFVVFAAAVSIVCAAGEISQATEVAGSAVPSADLREIFLEKCARCHEPERSSAIIDDYRAWVLTVARMSIKERRWIASEDVKHIIANHRSCRAEGIVLFDERRGECHPREKQGEKKTSPAPPAGNRALEISLAATYSPTSLPRQYHRRWRA